jgi:hypothetical protein
MAYSKSTSVTLSPDVAEGIKQVHDVLGLPMNRQINDAWHDKYIYEYAPLIKAQARQQAKAKRGGKRGFGQEIVG